MNNFVRAGVATASETMADSYNASLYRTDAPKGVGCVRPYVYEVEVNGVRTTMGIYLERHLALSVNNNSQMAGSVYVAITSCQQSRVGRQASNS